MNKTNPFKKLMHQEQYMLNQFCSNLQTTITRLSAKDKDKDKDKDKEANENLTSLEKQLNNELSWPNANSIELAIIDYFDEITLTSEWKRRLAEIHYLPDNLKSFYKENSDETDPKILKTLYSRLVTDLQWIRESKRVIRFHESQMRIKIAWLFLFCFVLFFLPTILRTIFSYEFENLRLYYIYTAASSGILGATFSQLTSLKSLVELATVDQVKAMSHLSYIIARAMVGAGAGLIMFYLVQSGLLSGAFFPEFIHSASELTKYQSDLGTTENQLKANLQGVSLNIESNLAVGTLARPAHGLSLLIVWCLIAGFSEKLIPGILNSKAKNTRET